MWAPSWRRDLQCRFGTSSYRAAFDPVVEKWFGVSLAAGTLGDDGSVRCVAPTSEYAGLARSLRFAFADVSVVGSNVTGDGAHALLLPSRARIDHVGLYDALRARGFEHERLKD